MSTPRKYDLPEDIIEKREREKKISKDEIVKITRRPNYSTEDLIRAILKQAAEENMQLTLLRESENLDPVDFVALTKRKSEILKQIGDLTLNLHKTLEINEINLKSESFKILIGLIIRYLDTSLTNARLSDEHKENVIHEFMNVLENLEKEYKDELRSKGVK